MDSNDLNKFGLSGLYIGIPLAIFPGVLNLPPYLTYTLIPVGVILCMLGTGAAFTKIQREKSRG
ncbi:hypothetical protein [Pontibacillus marinus]|uniref:Uncharacterized protein n=1 Tax=Pontibacillus marinus BH030004 = DSM 16465 TaxID=1385511 RepID=A0A0A5G453_9BACI|nr:hypothetical protein [Pontibacillus marinus]KGX85913.1 hypothetical protein N783_13050 [Pontibacillus marinus BH030004 = DSM 16465]